MTPASPDSTSPALGIPVRALANERTGREVLQLMLALKQRLSEHGISIPVTAPNAYAQLLLAGGDIEDADLQNLRRRLREVDPPSTCVYQFAHAEGQLMCARCGKVLTLQIPARATLSAPLSTQCPSCQMPFAVAMG